MTILGWLAALVLFLQLPIPLYWFVLHPGAKIWRRYRKAGYVLGLVCSWLPVTIALIVFRESLFKANRPPLASVVAAIMLIIFEGWVFWRVHRDLGTGRLVGDAEITGRGELAQDGIYGRVRHPRYAASFLAILGACLLAGTKILWFIAGIWLVLMLVAISIEEREMQRRFTKDYDEYRKRVPRFLPRLLI